MANRPILTLSKSPSVGDADSSIKSPCPQLAEHPDPVDSVARRVVFAKGEHFDIELPDNIRTRFWGAPPKCQPRPERVKDYTQWLCQCDCGMYELRRPQRWLKHPSKIDDPDRCEFCRLNDKLVSGKKTSRDTRGQRLLKWGRSMLNLGLNHDEIVEIMQINDDPNRLSGSGISTKDCTAEQIREQLKAAKERPIVCDIPHDMDKPPIDRGLQPQSIDVFYNPADSKVAWLKQALAGVGSFIRSAFAFIQKKQGNTP